MQIMDFIIGRHVVIWVLTEDTVISTELVTVIGYHSLCLRLISLDMGAHYIDSA